jgi:iron complex transport system substrate-binding protein
MLDNTGCARGRPSRCMALRGRLVLSVRCMLLALLLAGGATATSAAETAKRIIPLGGDVTEIVYALGEDGRLVGRDTTSTFPMETTDLPSVGYFRQLGAEGVLSLQPDLILAATAAGPAEALKQISAAGVKVVTMPESFSPDGLVRKVGIIAEALGVPEKGKSLAAKLVAELDKAKAAVAAMPGRPKVLFIIAAGGGAPMAAGTQTAADALVGLAGAENVFSAHTGYKSISLEAAAAAAPEAIAMMTQTLDNLGGIDGVAQHPALRLTPAAKAHRIIARDGNYMLGFGPRLPQAMVEFAGAIRSKAKP